MQENKEKFSLDEILSIKKAEKPSAAEWEDFNSQLKSKMLKSIVEQDSSANRYYLSPWGFAKLAILSVPLLFASFVFFYNSKNIDNVVLKNSSSLVEIPNMETSYHSDRFFSSKQSNRKYSQNEITEGETPSIKYATNSVLANNLSF